METNFKEKRVKRSQKNFSEETRSLFDDCYECFMCGMNRWDALHHVMGGNFEEANSPLNACPIHNTKCHVGIGHHFTEEQTNNFLQKTQEYLYRKGYRLTEKDKRFLEKFKSRYNKIILK